MAQSLQDMYQSHWQRLTSESVTWHWKETDLRIRKTFYLADVLPDLHYVSSVRAVLLQGKEVLLVTNKDGVQHIIPGGRLEANETIMEGLAREILEETGYTFINPQLVAIIHYQHLTPKPQRYPYPYPEFLQVVYKIDPDTYDEASKVVGDYEQSSHL